MCQLFYIPPPRVYEFGHTIAPGHLKPYPLRKITYATFGYYETALLDAPVLC